VTMDTTAVIGIGNVLMSDEGAGIEVVGELQERLDEVEVGPDEVEIIDAGTCIFTSMPRLDRFDRLIVVDCVRGGREAGTLYRFGLEDIEGAARTVSLHDMGCLSSGSNRRPFSPVFGFRLRYAGGCAARWMPY
jgi:hydrogenase maturation protease